MDDYLVPLPDMSFASPGSNNANTGATKSSTDVSPEAKKNGNASSSINSKSKNMPNMLITSSMLHWNTSEANMPKSTITTANKMAERYTADVKTFVVEGEEMYIASNIGNSSDYYVVL